MSRWLFRLTLTIVLLGLAVWAWTILYPGPEKAIRKRLANLASSLSAESGEGQISRVAKTQNLAGFFTPDVEVAIDVPGYHLDTIQGRDELLQMAMAAKSRAGSIKVEIVDVTVAVAPDGQSAEAHFTGKAQVSGERTLQAQELKARLLKVNGHWVLSHIETIRTLL